MYYEPDLVPDHVVSDVLIKAAEDVVQGLWCKQAWFATDVDLEGLAYTETSLFDGDITVDEAAQMHRCAEGSIAYVTMLAGYEEAEAVAVYGAALDRVQEHLHDGPGEYAGCQHRLSSHNDYCLVNFDSLTAGQELAKLFRRAAGVE